KEQLLSIESQTYQAWRLWVSDDGSTDETLDILHEFKKKWGEEKLQILHGPQQGFVANFLFLTNNQNVQADYYAWSDQDDIWLHHKLSRALSLLPPPEVLNPSLYCGRTILVDAENTHYGVSPLMAISPCFANALVQCLASGNTMIFNKTARDLIAKGSGTKIISHDWWSYQVVSGCGGQVIYDAEPTLRYRQHHSNRIGSNMGLSAKSLRLKKMLKGDFKQWNDEHAKALFTVVNELTLENKQLLEAFNRMRAFKNPLKRLYALKQTGLYRQTKKEQLALYLAAGIGRL
ncbi:MAG: glycosyltransferase, partial [Candidatus Adiutrix sp.]